MLQLGAQTGAGGTAPPQPITQPLPSSCETTPPKTSDTKQQEKNTPTQDNA